MEIFSLESTNLEDMGFSCGSPSLKTITVNRREGVKEGMHFDTKDKPDFFSRTQSRIRFNVNLGPSPRWFLFSPMSIEQVLEIKKITCSGDTDPIILIHDAYESADAIINCVQLDAGEGYFSPTDLVFHDASSFWANERHFVYQILANTVPKKFV